ncbi:hypothetical protein [Pseudomonas sp. NPDC089569]|uniref:hypothetical protein n=1 Tax=Pseudomonas sp. NPDC089569 TaxID=3390722 RepID=UPI003CFF92E7
MAGQATLTLMMAMLAGVVIVMLAILAAATLAAALVTAASVAAAGLAGRFLADACTPQQLMLMATLQTGSLATVTELMQQVNLAMITATI